MYSNNIMNTNTAKKKNHSISLVKPIKLSSLDKFKRIQKAESEIDEELSKLGDLTQLKDDEAQLIHLICNLVENLSSVKLSGEEKKDFVMKKIKQLLPVLNNDSDLKWIGKIIDILCLVGSVAKVAKSEEAIKGVKSICGFF